MHIRAYLFLMAAGILIPVVLFSGVALRMLQDAEREAALGALGETANGVALRVDRELYSATAALQVLAASPSLQRGDLRAFYQEATTSNRAATVWLVLMDETGRQLVNTSRPFGAALPGANPQALADTRLPVSDLVVGALNTRLITTVNLPVLLADGRRYVLSQRFSTDHFNAIVRETTVAPGWLVAIIDGQGRFVARNLHADKLIGAQARPELVTAMRQAPKGRIRHLTLEGTEAHDVFTHPSMGLWGVAVAAPVAQIERSARNASFVAALGLLAATACAAGFAAYFGRLHVRSIGRAVGAASDLGNGIAPTALTSRVVEMNELHTALYAAGEQMRQAQAYRKHAEAERQALLEAERKARQMAEHQSTAKDQFLAMLGHELRNPLAPISTAAQLLRLVPGDPARVQAASAVIARQVDHMNSLLGDMLDVSRVTRGLVALSLEPVDLNGVIERAHEQVASLVQLKQHALTLDLPATPLWVEGDQTRLIQIFANLLGNAAKYTPSHGQITVSARIEGSVVTARVSDNGEGLPAELLPRIFELFAQGERAPDRAQGGLGLGLALVRSLVQLHGGSVTASSDGAGQGSCFCVTLPLCTARAPLPVTSAALGGAGARPLRVMVVDDNVDGAQSLSQLLEEAGGHLLTTCHDGASALAAASSAMPEVFILDVGLPDMTGYALASRLRAMAPFGDATFVALTGYGQPQDRARAREAGFDQHLAKPANLQVILDLLARIPRRD